MKRTQLKSGNPRNSPDARRTKPSFEENPDQQYVKELEANLKRYQDIIANVDDMIFEIDQTGHIQFVNPNFESVLGYKTEEIIGNVPTKFMSPDEAREKYEKFLELASRNEKIKMEMTYIHKDGHLITLETSAMPFFSPDGKLLGYRGINRDTTQRKQAEAELKHDSEQFQLTAKKFENIFLNSPAFHSLSSLEKGILLEVNPAFEALTGYSREEMIGKSAFDLRIWADPDERKRMVELLKKDGVVSGQEVKAEGRHPSGQIRNVLLYCNRLEIDGQDCWLTSGLDITEAKKAENELKKAKYELEDRVQERTSELSRITEELRNSEEAYRLLVERNPVGVFRLEYDPVKDEMKRLNCNDAHLQMLGYSSQSEYLADNVSSFFYNEADLLKCRNRLLKDRKVINFKLKAIRKNGNAFWGLLNMIACDYSDKVSLEGSVVDISDQVRIEERLRSARKNLRSMVSELILTEERSRQHFATDLHDTVVQTLGAAKLRAQLVEDNIQKKAKPTFAELQSLISDAIVQARSIMTEMSPPVLNELGVVSALEWLTEQFGNRYGITIKFDSKDKMKTLLLSRDIEVLLFQATRELLMNIVKHSNARSALVKFSNRGPNVKLEVSDTGMGFDKKKSFQPDFSGGFGLYSIRERLHHLGGVLAIKSKPGQGTRILITAPREISKSPE